MKLLFTQPQSLLSEKSGNLLFALENVEGPTENVAETERKDLENKAHLEARQEQADLVTEVQEKLRINEAIEKGNLLFEKMQADIARELPEEQAKRLSPAQYGSKLEDIISGKKYQAQITEWWDNHGKLIPEDYTSNLKIGAAIGTVAFGSTAGGIKDRLTSAAKWGGLAACLAHPTLTTGIARTASTIGKDIVAPGFVGATNLIIEAIDNPMGLAKAFKESNLNGRSISDTPIYQLLRHGKGSQENFTKEIATGTQSSFELQSEGLQISDPNLKKVMDAIELAKLNEQNGKPANFDRTAIPAAATFVLQTAAHKMGESEMANFRLKIWNQEASPNQVRKVLANNAEKEILTFFQKDPELWRELQSEMSRQRIENAKSGVSQKELDLAKTFIDQNAESGAEFNLENKKHGVRRFMSMGAGGMALATYVISFLSIQGIMKLKGLAQPKTYSEKLPKLAKNVAKIPVKVMMIPIKTINALGKMAGLGKAQRLMRNLDNVKPKSPFNKGERKKVWKLMSKEDKKTFISQTKELVKKEKAENDGRVEYKELPQILQDKLAEIRNAETNK